MKRMISMNRWLVLAMALLFSGCALFPRTATWTPGDATFTADQVYDATLMAVTQTGFTIRHTDGSARLATVEKNVGDRRMVLTLSVRSMVDGVQLLSRAEYVGGVAIKGLHEAYLMKLHEAVVSALGLPPDAVDRIVITVDR